MTLAIAAVTGVGATGTVAAHALPVHPSTVLESEA